MNLSHKIEIKPNNEQGHKLKMACGVARYAYNWGLVEWKKAYGAGLKSNGRSLKLKWNKEKPDWVYLSPKGANQRPFDDLQNAYKRFFKRESKYPKLKKKGIRDSFYVENDKFSIVEDKIRLPKIGLIKLTERPRFDGKIMSATVSRCANRWFVSISVNIDQYSKKRTANGIIGIDLGVATALTLSTGEKLVGPKPLKKKLKTLKKRQRKHSRKKKGSNNRKKSAIRLAILHRKIRNQRNDFLHKVTTRLCRENQVVVIEDLAVANMLKNHKLARAISDIGFGEFRRQLTYKSMIYGTTIIVADRFFPSTKLCRMCGQLNAMPLSQRTYKCDCGHAEDRDINAARNLYTLGYREIYARGQEGSGSADRVKPAWMNREILSAHNCVQEM